MCQNASAMSKATWMDQVLAAPVVGVLFEPWMAFPSAVWSAIESLAEKKWRDDGGGKVQITARGATAVRVDRDNGIYFDLEPANVVCGFNYRVSVKERPGQLPEIVHASEARAYSELLTQVQQSLSDLLTELSPKRRYLTRIGVVAECRLLEEHAPPGINQFVEAMGAPWPGRLRAAQSTLLAELLHSDGTRDQCHHGMVMNAYDRPGDWVVRLDWQRLWTPPQSMPASDVAKEMRLAAEAASSYFQDFGSGAWPS